MSSNSSITPPSSPPQSGMGALGGIQATHNQTVRFLRRVKIIVKDGHDTAGPGMTFELRFSNTFKDAFDTFKVACCNTCRAPNEVRFKIKETQDPVEQSDTPRKLNLLHNTITEITAWSNMPGLQCAGCKLKGYPKTSGVKVPKPQTLDPKSADNETIVLRLQDQTGYEVNMKMLNTVPMAYLMDVFAQRAMRERRCLRFFVDGEKLNEKETPKQLGLINGAKIEVFIEQLGG